MDVGGDSETLGYKNWVRGTKAVEYLQEGLQSFVGRTVLNQRDRTLQKITDMFPSGSPTGMFSSGSPTGMFSSGSPTGMFSSGSATGMFSSGSPTGMFSSGSPTGMFSSGSPTGMFSSGSPTGMFPPGSATGMFSSGSATGMFPPGSPTGMFPPGSPTGIFPPGSPTGMFSSGSPIQCNQCSLLNLLPEHAIANKSCDQDTCIQQSSANCLGSRPKGRRKCPNGICSKLYDEIVHTHRFKDPKWKHTDISTWCFDREGWSFAKCFQTTPHPGTSSTETDATGLLSIILNDNVFQNTLACNLDTKNNVFAVARQMSNYLLCRRNMEVQEPELNSSIDIFIAVLQDPKYLIHDPAAKLSVQNLVQLKNNQIRFSMNEQIKLLQGRKDALLALEQLEEADAVALWEGHGQIAVAETEGIKPDASEKFSKIELKKYIQRTEEKIQQLTERGQNLKKKSGVIVDSSTHNDKNLPLFSEAPCTDSIDSDQVIKRVIDKAWNILIDYMRPDPILDCAMEYDLLGYRQTRDIREEKNTSEKNRKILGKIRSNVKTDYGKLKSCLIRTGQSRLVQILECIEKGQDTIILLEEIHEEKKCEVPKVAKDETGKSVIKKKSIMEKLSEKLGFGKARWRKVLKKDLIDLYRQCHNTIPLSPLIEEEDAPLTRFYVLPKINKVEVQRALGGGTEVKTQVGSLHDVFYNKGKLVKEIYLTANAGLGKTSFSKRLALAWCQAHNPIKSDRTCFSEEEIDAMRKFDFVFLLLLRQSTDACDIDDLIMLQIIPGLITGGTRTIVFGRDVFGHS